MRERQTRVRTQTKHNKSQGKAASWIDRGEMGRSSAAPLQCGFGQDAEEKPQSLRGLRPALQVAAGHRGEPEGK
jgi:hypothetical protein